MRKLILLLLIVAPVAFVLLWRHSPLAAIGIVALSHALVLYPTLRPNVQWLGPVVTRFATDTKEVWLTIDDGPTDDTPLLLDSFDGRGVKATFFVKGTLAAARPDLIALIQARGHSVANHSHTHPSATFWCLPPDRIAEEIDRCNEALRVSGVETTWFRAPVGLKNPAVHPALKKRGMRLIGWTARGFDAVVDDPEKVYGRILPDIEPGAIILLHQGRSYSQAVLERTIDGLQALGYAFVIPDDGRLKTKR